MSKNNSKYKTYEQYDIIHNTFMKRFQNIAYNMFIWDGLPDEIQPRYIERALYENGAVAFGYDKAKKLYLALPYTAQSNLNLYGEFVDYQLIAYNGGYTKRFDKAGTWAMRGGKMIENTKENGDVAVEVRNNTLRQPTIDFVSIYVNKMTDVEFTTKMNLDAQKMPYMFMTTQKNQATLKNMYRKLQAFEPIILADRNKLDGPNTLEVQDFNAPYIGDKLHQQFKAYEAELLTYLGINNVQVEKSERVQSAEVNANNQFINFNLMAMLDSRQKAVEEINEHFDLDVSVSINVEYISAIYEAMMAEANDTTNDNDSEVNTDE